MTIRAICSRIKWWKRFLHAKGFDVWKSIVHGYTAPTTPPTNIDWNKLNKNKSKDKGIIMRNLVDKVFVKVMHCDSSKNIWGKLQNIYGDAKVKGDNIQICKAKFEKLKMKEDEDIVTYLLQVEETINTIKGLGV